MKLFGSRAPVRNPRLRIACAFLNNAVVGLVLLALGVLGLQITPYPGLGSLFWPALGWAVAARLAGGLSVLPGLLGGSLAIHWLSAPLEAMGYPSATAWTVWVALSAVAFLQIEVGVWVARKAVHSPRVCHSNLAIARSYFWICVPTAFLGGGLTHFVLLLFGQGILPPPQTWWVWTVGSMIGMAVFGPLIHIWVHSHDGRRIANSLRYFAPVLFTTVLILVVFQSLLAGARERQEQEFERQSTHLILHLRELRDFFLTAHAWAQSHFRQTSTFTPEFLDELAEVVKPQTGIQAITWIPFVRGSDREHWEHERQRTEPGFCFRAYTASGPMPPSERADFHFPIYHITPRAGNERALGLDLSTRAESLATLLKSMRTGMTLASPPVRLTQEEGQSTGVVLYTATRPVQFDSELPSLKSGEVGFFSFVLRIDDTLVHLARRLTSDRLLIRIVDCTDRRNPTVLGTVLGTTPIHPHGEGSARRHSQRPSQPQLRFAEEIDFAGRCWEVEVERGSVLWLPSDPMLRMTALAFILGTLLPIILGTFLLGNFRQLHVVEELVDERTRELRTALAQAESATQAKAEFLASVSHELRTPLNGIVATADLLRTMEADDPERDSLLDILNGSAGVLLSVVNNVLDYSKMSEGKILYQRIPFHPADVVREALLIVRPLASSKRLEVVFSPKPLPRPAHNDPDRVRQILINLLSNAVKFTRTGRITVTLGLSSEDTAQSFFISVADTGVGIPKDRQSRLFQRFSQASGSTSRQYGGSGLGLAISKGFATQMGGDLSFISEPGQGSTFTLTLPFDPP